MPKIYKLIADDRENATERVALRMTRRQMAEVRKKANAYHCTLSALIRAAVEHFVPNRSQLEEIEIEQDTKKTRNQNQR